MQNGFLMQIYSKMLEVEMCEKITEVIRMQG